MSAADDFPRTPATTVRRLAQRGRHDRALIYSILDEALVCHVGFEWQGQPFVIPTIHVRLDDRLYIHGSPASRMLRAVGGGARACVTVTLLDGLVLARSAFHHSMNYRSVVILACGRQVEDEIEKKQALHALVEHVVPGRSAEARPPSPGELQATTLIRFPIQEASAKVRSGPPLDDAADMDLPVWAGVVPLELKAGSPVGDPAQSPARPPPAYVQGYRRHIGDVF
jgi:nitroimidazol reductase NimA-like FMN-containing flavoprotein (pyridoxamine 5'-phosphate oxidase superfamily)